MTGDTLLSEDNLSSNQLSDNQPVQKTLDGMSLPPLPKVRTTEGFIVNWDRNIIVNQLLKETKLSEVFYNKPPITKEEALDIAKEAERLIRRMNAKFLSGPLIREIVNTILLERGHVEWRNIMTRVGASVYDAYEIDTGYGFEANDNANQLNNAETSHKKKADKMSKEQNLLLMPKELADLHLNGDFHIHDLEYMGTRPFCLDGSTVIPMRWNGKILSKRLDEMPVEGDETAFEDLEVITPKGWGKVRKITRRPVKSGELLCICSSSGRKIKVTKDHRVPICINGKMEIKKAGDISIGDELFVTAEKELKPVSNPASNPASNSNPASSSGPASSPAANNDEFLKRTEKVSSVSEEIPSGAYVYDLFLKGDESTESHTFYTAQGILIHNCQDWDLRYFFYYGLMPDGVGSQSSVAKPAKNAEVAFLHAVKAMGSAQTNFAGGQGFYNFLTFMAPYLEGKSYKEVKQLMQMFVYEMMQMMCARGGQTVFSSVQLSPGVPRLWKDKPVVAMGKIWNGKQASLKTYGEFEKEVRLGFKALMDVMLEGDAWGKPFSFPKPEISLEPDFMKEDEEFNKVHPELPTYKELYRMTFELASKFGTPYFDNQLPEYRGAGEGISCYQCLAADEFVSFTEPDGQVRIKQIGEIFERAAKEGKETDPFGVEFAKLNGKTPSVDFDRLEASLRDFKGIMRQKYKGKILNIVLESGRRIRVTPIHPVFVLENGKFVKTAAKKLKEGDYMPVLKETDFPTPTVTSIDLEELLTEAGYGGEIVAENGMVNIKNAKKTGLPSHMPVTDELVRFLGYYLAEGCSDHSGRRWSVRLSFGKTEEALISDAKMCLLALGLDPGISEEKTATNVVVNSKLFYLILKALGCGQGAHSKSVPDLLFNVDTSFVGTYISCAFKGDGNVNTQKGKVGDYPHNANAIRMRLVSREAVQKLIWLGERSGIQMNYMAREETVKHPQTGEPYSLKTYTCYVTSQDQIKNFCEQTGYGKGAISENEKGTAGCFTRIPIKESGLDHSKLKYPAQYRAEGRRSVNQAHVLDTSGAPMADLLINGKVHALEIKKIEEEEYSGFVYDLVDVSETHSFSNALGIVTGNCCAYQFSANPTDDAEFTEKLYFKDGKHFSMGSWMVMSLNCPRAAYKAEHDDEKLFKELKFLMNRAVEVFKVKRRWMDSLIKMNRIPFASQRPKDPNTGEKGAIAVDFSGLVYTIGVIGINEMVQYHTGFQMHESPIAYKLAIRAMFEMKMYAQKLSEEVGMEIALARTPAETTAQRFAVSDLLHMEYADKAMTTIKGDLDSALRDINETHDLPIYYTNGTHVPPGADISLAERIKYEHTFFPVVDGGNIMHIWLGEGQPDPDGLQELAMHIAKNTQTGYFAFTRDMTICLDEGYVASGLLDKCPKCGSENVDHLSRITGYLQPVSGWNKGKQQELKDRKHYNVREFQ